MTLLLIACSLNAKETPRPKHDLFLFLKGAIADRLACVDPESRLRRTFLLNKPVPDQTGIREGAKTRTPG